ncbi:multimeric flavodoxin WrbA [Mycolicibacterium sp. BK556]|uniref:flavodoxin family protein n=1 Tax=Mycobacteriaceae TaxID=1762 RepID=UPI00105DBB45|nr:MULTISPECIES: flavodoxin family protein [Mycobacteriaceae]MBB3603573.1 multimeric flavodoxin WrbA [Mycolicibacterium sp. BK556]MBB3633768.1 multimeric flavodoxin WrbA [Mycolicibacterium sp. BK607]MBB3751350.1 multimeric flavodoxin WrbA [Mycolicibacterium sp. BK634]TDO11881.1 multimeric flavodoxin WrbA [Mycobacterium sp. BK086]
MVTPRIVVAYHSGFGHTATLARAVGRGAESAGATVSLIPVDTVDDEHWATLDGADAIIFGCPTYMGNASAGFQTFAEQTGRRCMEGTWRDKVGAGFTNSGSKAGDKLQTLSALSVFAAQHHMHWVNLGLTPGWNTSGASEFDLNRLGFWLGAGASTDVDADPAAVHDADLRTCEHLGQRVATVTTQLLAGRLAATR